MSETTKWRIAQKLEIRWWKRYLGKKDVRTYLEWKRNYWQAFLEPLRDIVQTDGNQRILDAGCGPAGIFMLFSETADVPSAARRIVAVDPLISRYRELPHFDPGNYPNVLFLESTMEDFRYRDKFDLVFCLNALNHVSDIRGAAQVLIDHLKSDGRLILSIDCHRSSFMKEVFRKVPGDALHPHQLDLGDYKGLIDACGGRIVREYLSKPGRIFNYHVLVVEKVGE